MNIFMPEVLIANSVMTLDDRRLIKQILECYQIIRINERVLAGEENVGYRNHPVVKFYRDKIPFVIKYGMVACSEYFVRFCKCHTYQDFFTDHWRNYPQISDIYNVLYCEKRSTELYEKSVEYDVKNHRLEDVHLLFREKLINKWNNDKRKPTWTGIQCPNWYKNKE